ncbi:hypothetical protein C8F04DRAFT_1252623 [Mycena alexandri]|uniref:Uncharacterized protein n=1 Tax=Mycena alexandri TaxID=1745969 RepID=A0AAD6XDX0_9AGAR|nr:hypothetical protein C8F04DRAFT_1252623 [Mycena alexandri]
MSRRSRHGRRPTLGAADNPILMDENGHFVESFSPPKRLPSGRLRQINRGPPSIINAVPFWSDPTSPTPARRGSRISESKCKNLLVNGFFYGLFFLFYGILVNGILVNGILVNDSLFPTRPRAAPSLGPFKEGCCAGTPVACSNAAYSAPTATAMSAFASGFNKTGNALGVADPRARDLSKTMTKWPPSPLIIQAVPLGSD